MASGELNLAATQASVAREIKKVSARQKYEESKSLSFIEVALRRHQLDLSRRIFLGFPYSVGIMLAFLVLKENEARNLAAVLAGVSAGLPTDDLRSLLAVRE